MEKIFNVQKMPDVISYAVLADFDIEKFKVEKTIDIYVENYTKTTIQTDMQFENHRVGINIKNPNFTQHKVSSYSYFTNRLNESYYFKITKKQSFSEYRKYLEDSLEYFFRNLDIDTLKVNIYTNIVELGEAFS